MVVLVGVWHLSLPALEMDEKQICRYISRNIYTCTYEQNRSFCVAKPSVCVCVGGSLHGEFCLFLCPQWDKIDISFMALDLCCQLL